MKLSFKKSYLVTSDTFDVFFIVTYCRVDNNSSKDFYSCVEIDQQNGKTFIEMVCLFFLSSFLVILLLIGFFFLFIFFTFILLLIGIFIALQGWFNQFLFIYSFYHMIRTGIPYNPASSSSCFSYCIISQ